MKLSCGSVLFYDLTIAIAYAIIYDFEQISDNAK